MILKCDLNELLMNLFYVIKRNINVFTFKSKLRIIHKTNI